MSDDENRLVDTDGLTVRFLDEEPPKLEFVSDPEVYDLSSEDDVIVIVDGEGADIDCESRERATATLPDLDDVSSVMIRVHEFFDGWDLH